MNEPITAAEIAAQKEWERPHQERRTLRAAKLDDLRAQMRLQVVLMVNATEAAFLSGDLSMVDAAEEECLRLLDLVRKAKRDR